MTDTQIQAPTRTRTREPRHGVDTPTLFATLDVVRGQRELAAFTFRASNQWVRGTHSRSTFTGFQGAGGEHVHKTAFTCDADHPAVLVGADQGPTPIEYLLHALASCLTSGIANIAAARGITITKIESQVSGRIDLQGIFGMSDAVRNGYEDIEISFVVEGDAPKEMLASLVEQSRARSAVFDVLSNGCPVAVKVA
ncbi:MAG: OsmC family protein [Sandaracinus sp.]|nr:OsmC family protein [Myxococcales bacterium]MCB9598874.1 OsmC family protein [Sandaracinus sp.]MCB9631983.1 OsmC family protein [Sandaracinus sp.]